MMNLGDLLVIRRISERCITSKIYLFRRKMAVHRVVFCLFISIFCQQHVYAVEGFKDVHWSLDATFTSTFGETADVYILWSYDWPMN